MASGSQYTIAEFGSAAAIAAIQPPAQPPDGAEEDDQACQTDPKEKCSDCGGGGDTFDLCNTGTQAGCPCDEPQECDAQPPKCSDCGGDNGQSQCSGSGPTNGCVCCPDTLPDCRS